MRKPREEPRAGPPGLASRPAAHALLLPPEQTPLTHRRSKVWSPGREPHGRGPGVGHSWGGPGGRLPSRARWSRVVLPHARGPMMHLHRWHSWGDDGVRGAGKQLRAPPGTEIAAGPGKRGCRGASAAKKGLKEQGTQIFSARGKGLDARVWKKRWDSECVQPWDNKEPPSLEILDKLPK